jgi:hypothetical protein
MFKVTSKPTFAHDVEIQVPVDGGFETRQLKTRFRVVDVAKLKDLKMGVYEDESKLLDMIVDGFEDLVDEQEKPITNPEKYTKIFLGQMFVRKPVMEVYMEAMAGAKAKN